ncbi:MULTISPECIES: metal-sensing transcriptional repressor [Oscillatoriales]|uniref:metal-sensing transcriptional repressor n=1 Tax=Limnospira TaxID=2596745 RepID=UPI0016823812|nr:MULTISPECIES: metal-sensing transcriptional repressor [Oscillatoriales]MBD2575707.1 metal-sensing transcriptional repressor [Arthrospira platensis FACHB-971]MDT9241994.1 metal-sensing transcriptional repressor [Limnospira sp. PMC 1261.20]MDT9272554.1 metal-sensing transcriptional repressor [Limnospira sp. PMC 1234.20]
MQADKSKILRKLKTARGQMEGLLKMVEEDRYCIDISNQLMATQAILKRVNADILQEHLGQCVVEAFDKADQKAKIQEIMMVMDKLNR